MYVTCYVRLDIDPDTNLVYLYADAAYFGGLYPTLHDAEQSARECVSTDWEGFGKGTLGRRRGDSIRGLILPRVFTLEEGETVIDVLYRAQTWYEKLLAQMNEAATILAYS